MRIEKREREENGARGHRRKSGCPCHHLVLAKKEIFGKMRKTSKRNLTNNFNKFLQITDRDSETEKEREREQKREGRQNGRRRGVQNEIKKRKSGERKG